MYFFETGNISFLFYLHNKQVKFQMERDYHRLETRKMLMMRCVLEWSSHMYIFMAILKSKPKHDNDKNGTY